MKKVRCALIGAGWWGTTAHLPALKRHPHAEVVAVFSRSQKKAEGVAADFGVPHACNTIEEALAVPGLEAVIISTTPNVHYAQAKAALERGLHVLVEKPMTITAAESVELLTLAQQNGLQLVLSCPWHYTTHALEARRLILSGGLGQLKCISVLMTNFVSGLYAGAAWDDFFGKNPTEQNAASPYLKPGATSYSDPKVSGGGHVYCQVSHVAGHLNFLTGRQPAEVFARFDNSGTAVDVYDTLSLKLDDGTLVSMASHGAPMFSGRNYEVRVYGTEGMILMELWQGKMEFHNRRCEITRYPDLTEAEAYPMHAPAENFIDCILSRAANGSPGETGVFAMQVIEAASQSVRTGQNIVLENSIRPELPARKTRPQPATAMAALAP